MNIAEAIEKILVEEGCEEVIFAKKPWSEDSEAIISKLSKDYSAPTILKANGFDYFLEGAIVDELADIKKNKIIDANQFVRFVVFYADNDAYPEWIDDLPSK